MDITLVVFLVALLALAALLYYVFIVKQSPDAGGKGFVGLIVILFILTPAVLVMLWIQTTSDDRLNEIGFRPHPALRSSVGLATGIGDNPVWVFAIDGDPRQIMEFYKVQDNHSGWQLVYEGQNLLVYEREAQSLSIFLADDDVIFALRSTQ